MLGDRSSLRYFRKLPKTFSGLPNVLLALPSFFWLVPGVGLEPTRIAPADFKSAASADSATPAKGDILCVTDKVGVYLALLF